MDNLLQSGIVIAIVAGLWRQIKSFVWMFARLFIVRIQKTDVPFQKYYWDHLRSKKFLSPVFSFESFGSGEDSKIFYKIIGGEEFKLIRFNKRYAIARIDSDYQVTIYSLKFYLSYSDIYKKVSSYYSEIKKKQKKEEQQRFYTRYIRGSLNQAMTIGGGEDKTETPANIGYACKETYFRDFESFDVGHRLNYTAEEYEEITSFHSKDKKMMDYLYMSQRMKEVENRIKIWFDNKAWFFERGIQWKRGFLLYGVPGTGKTSFITSLAEKFRVPLFVFDLSTFTNEDLEKQWNKLRHSSPCFVLFEDFDAVFDGRKHLEQSSNMAAKPVSFDCVLNILDGAVKYDGIVTFITTNYIKNVDSALGGTNCSRPGRIDHVCNMDGLDQEAKEFIAKSIIYGFDGEEEMRSKIIEESKSTTPAQFKDECINAALSVYKEIETQHENIK